MLRDAADSLPLLEEIIAREGIECFYERKGRFVGAYTPRHYDDLARKLDALNRDADGEAYMLAKARQHEEIASEAWWCDAQASCIRRSTVRASSTHAGATGSLYAPGRARRRSRASLKGSR